MSRLEILNDGGFRVDGRRQHELRAFSILLSPQSSADGSASVSHGLTTVLATVYGPREARNRAQVQHDRASVNVEVSIAPFSTMERKKRNKGDKRLVEFAAAVKATFEPVIQTHLYPRSQIDIFIQVLQQDGGILSAAINASTLALIDAGIPMYDYVSSISSGCHSTSPLLDLNNVEESDIPHMTVAVLPRSGKVTLASLETRLHVDRFEEMFRLAVQACKVLHKEMDAAARERTKGLIDAMGGKIGGAAAAQPVDYEAGDIDFDMPDA